jgi:HAE1 family hydrophobic/amphiphilic exporter-1
MVVGFAASLPLGRETRDQRAQTAAPFAVSCTLLSRCPRATVSLSSLRSLPCGTGLSYQEKRASGSAFSIFKQPIAESFLVFGLAVLLVYLVLAALYESWLLPFAVILVVPLGLLGVVAAVNLRIWLHDKYAEGQRKITEGVGSWLDHHLPNVNTMDNNIYTQIGVVLIIALASKNAILIVEFARELRLSGRSIMQAAMEASRMRFRPIIMTSFAFILGVLPLVFATGAGAASRQSLGTAVCGGMLSATVLAVFFVPVFYVAFQSLIELISGPPQPLPGETLTVAEPEPEPVPVVKAEPVATANAPAAEKPSDNGKNGQPDDGKNAKEAPAEKPAPEKK